VRNAHSLNFRLEKASLIALVVVINGAGMLPRLVILLIMPYNEGHRLSAAGIASAIYYARVPSLRLTSVDVQTD